MPPSPRKTLRAEPTPKPSAAFAFPPRAWIVLQGAVILAAVAVIYAPARRGGWLWDDNSELTTNLDLRGPWWKLWSAPTSPDYFPLKSTVQWIEWRLWQQDSTLGYHLTSIGLHAVSALLVWRLLARLGLRLAWVGGLLFAIYPLAVESVAWLAELKNTLSLPPLLLAALAWLAFDDRRRARDYARSAGWFVVALLCKSSVVMLPVMLLLHAGWKRGRLGGRDVQAIAPFFAIALGFGLITLWFQSQRTGLASSLGGPLDRLALVGSTIGFYLRKLIWPFDLLPAYPAWTIQPLSPTAWLPWLLLAALAVAAWIKRASRGRHVIFGLGCILASLFPVLGFVSMSYFRISWVSDHLAYLALVPAAGMIAAGLGFVWARVPAFSRTTVGLAAGAIGLLLVVQARAYATVFRDAETLWSYTLQRDPNSWLAYNNLGVVRLEQARWEDAIAAFTSAAQLKPDYAVAQSNWGDALARLHRLPEAIVHDETALRLDPDSVEAHYNLANALVQSGRAPDAVPHYDAALRLAPASVDAHYNLANTLLQLERWDDAAAHFRAALVIQPRSLESRLGLGNALAAGGHLPEAVQEFQQAVADQPQSVDARYCLADALVQLARAPEALLHYEAAVGLAPERTDLRLSFAQALVACGRKNDAAAQLQAVLQLHPGDPAARAGLQQLQSMR
jgi:tetratricopeptide (TPR) repeat protein